MHPPRALTLPCRYFSNPIPHQSHDALSRTRRRSAWQRHRCLWQRRPFDSPYSAAASLTPSLMKAVYVYQRW